jgi:hypothetical protein
MSSATLTTFDLPRFARAAHERDAATQLSMYGPQATVTIVDKNTQPSAPRVLRGTGEIGPWLEDMYGRDMTHEVGHTVSDAGGAAYTQACQYPDGARVLCATVIELEQGLIDRQSVIQVWDEA